MAWTSGRYLLTGQAHNQSFSLVLRLDLDPQSTTSSVVSGDLYFGKLPENNDPDQGLASASVSYLGSYRSKRGTQSVTDKTLLVQVWLLPDLGSPQGLYLEIGSVDGGSDSLQARVTPQGNRSIFAQVGILPEALTMQGPALGESFRTLVLQVDQFAKAPDPLNVSAPVTGPGGFGHTSFKARMAAAGFTVLSEPGNSKLPDAGSYSMDQLRTMAGIGASAGLLHLFPRTQAFLAANMMVVTSLADDNNTLGVMFDQVDRRCAAVFHDSLRSRFPGDDEFNANYLFTFVHELGHCLNLPHVFDNHPLTTTSDGFAGVGTGTPTFMNYPQNYTGSGGRLGTSPFVNQKFWEDFDFSFAPRELLELRHGDRLDILTGQGVHEYRGDFANPAACLALGGDSGAELRLVLRIRGGDRPAGHVFEFGEPVHVEAKLQSSVEEDMSFDTRLSISGGGLSLCYQAPDGRVRMYEPACRFCQAPAEKELNAHPDSAEPDAFFKDLSLSFGADSFPFMEPGRYLLRAAYRYLDTLLVSNVLPVFVRYPTSEIENVVVPLLDDEVSDYFAFRGVSGLPTAQACLESVFGSQCPKPGSHPLHWYFVAYQARMCARGMIQVDSANRAVSFQKRTDDALRLFSFAFGFRNVDVLGKNPKTKLSGLPYSNIELAKLGRVFHATLSEVGRTDLAQSLRGRLDIELKRRGVPQSIIDEYLPNGSPARPKLRSSRKSATPRTRRPKRK